MKKVLIFSLFVGLTACALPETRGQLYKHPLSECRRACLKGQLEYYTDESVECKCRKRVKREQTSKEAASSNLVLD